MEMPGFPSMPGMSIEEMTSMPPTPSATPTPNYTVTSPPMSPPPERSHTVGPAADYSPGSNDTSVEATVLLKVREGDEYKLALNMQQYSPDDITIKLNGNELTVEAAGHGEQFHQKHVIPDTIDLDAMSSSFSSDGVLVIKAPKK
jgi:crystallin alpha B